MIHSNTAHGGGITPSREHVEQNRHTTPIVSPQRGTMVTYPNVSHTGRSGVVLPNVGAQALMAVAASTGLSVPTPKPQLASPAAGTKSPQEQHNDLVAFRTLLEVFSKDARALGMKSAGVLAEQSRSLSKNAINRSEEQSKIAEERQARADKMSNIFSWIGKIVAAVVTVVSVVAAIFTGGASLVLAGAAIAYLVVDKGVELATGKSITGRAMSALAGPLGDLQKKLIESMKGLVGEEAAAIIAGAIIGTVVAAVAVAAMILARTAATAIVKALPIGKFLSAITSKLTALLGKSAANSLGRADQIVQIGAAGFGSVQSGAQVVIAHNERVAAQSQANMLVLETTSKLTSENERHLWAATQALEETIRDLAEMLSKHIGAQFDTSRAIARGSAQRAA